MSAAVYQLGSYRLLAELGHGGMADVYLAAVQGPRGMGFTKLAVVKKLRAGLADDPEFVTMLMDEARITARLSHPNVVQLFEVGKDGDTYFLAMEFLEGQPLFRIDQRAQKRGVSMPLDLTCAIISDLLAGLHHAHELVDYDQSPLAIVHRDVTPQNVFVTYDGVVKVVDFGLAKAMGRRTETQQGVVKGKYPYMSPEQVRGKPVDRRTDIFAAGVLLHNACAGKKLWAGLSDGEIVEALVSGSYEASPIARGANVPPALDRICRKALAYKKEDRYATAADMRAELEAFLGEASVSARRKLESTMKDLFASERGKLKQVIEAARLTGTTADGEALAAAAARAMLEGVGFVSEAPAAASSRRPRAPDAPPSSRRGLPDAPPSSRPRMSEGPAASSRRPAPAGRDRSTRPATPRSRGKSTKRGPSAVWTFLAAFVVFTGVLLALMTIRTRPELLHLERGGARTEAQRHAIPRSDVTPLWPVARSKSGAPDDPGAPPRIEVRGHGDGLEPSADPPPEPRAEAPAAPTAAPSSGASKKLDESLPW